MMLLELPADLILEICQSFCSHCRDNYLPGYYLGDSLTLIASKKCLFNLCRTSKALYAISVPILYHIFRNQKERLDTLALFLRTLSEEPSLSEHVRGIHLAVDFRPSLTPSLRHQFICNGAARRLGLVIPPREVQTWRALYIYETLSQLIIASSRNIEALIFRARATQGGNTRGGGQYLILSQLVENQDRNFCFPRLRFLSLGHDHDGDFSLESFASIFALAPNLRDLRVFSCLGAKPPLLLENVTRMEFSLTRLNRQAFTTVVSSCRALRTFIYQSGDDFATQGKEVTPGEIVTALSRHASTLHYLQLDCSDRQRSDGSHMGACLEGEHITSLQHFKALRILWLDGTSILFPQDGTTGPTNLLVDLLPTSIISLNLTKAPKAAAGWLLGIVRRASSFPLLEEVSLEGNERGGHLGEEEVTFEDENPGLQEAFKTVGIFFLLMRYDEPESDDDEEL